LLHGAIKSFTWRDSPNVVDDTVNIGPLALNYPLLQKLDVANIIDRHLPPDPCPSVSQKGTQTIFDDST
jgi:hypothetical protein